MFLYTTSKERKMPYRSSWHTLVIIQATVCFLTMCYGVTESLGDKVQMGRDIAFIIGVRKNYILKDTSYIKLRFFLSVLLYCF